MKESILGTYYKVYTGDLNSPEFSDCDGVCRPYHKDIGIREPEYMLGPEESAQAQLERFKHVVRHELIHAYCSESGVSYDQDEALVDWIAHMVPLIEQSFKNIMEGLGYEN